MYTLGINAALGDPSACLVKDGAVIAAAEEERFTGSRPVRKKVVFSPRDIPFHAINYCLSEEKIVLSDVDHIAYSFNPQAVAYPNEPRLSTWDTSFLSSVADAPRQLCDDVPHYLGDRFGSVTGDGPFVWHFVDHHLAHAAGAFLASPFSSAAVMTMDGGGETASTTYSLGAANSITGMGGIPPPYSLERLYAGVTEYLGFQVPWDEFKVMELATQGKPAFAGEFRRLIELRGNGQYVTQEIPLEMLFGPAREKNEQLEKRHFDIAASLQTVLQETVLELATWLNRETGEENLCLAGDIALNAALNGFLRQSSPFKAVWVPPAAGDAGTAAGAALWIDSIERRLLDAPRRYVLESADLGPGYPEGAIESFLKRSRMNYRRLSDIAAETAELLARDKVVAWFQGRMEFGPRPLGYRSILGSPLHEGMRQKINALKGREAFRPVGCAVPREQAEQWFHDGRPSPFMLFTGAFKQEKLQEAPGWGTAGAGTAGVATVDAGANPLFHRLLTAFGARTGVPLLMMTSLNVTGKPMSCSPQDATECFWTMPLDALVMGPFLVEKP